MRFTVDIKLNFPIGKNLKQKWGRDCSAWRAISAKICKKNSRDFQIFHYIWEKNSKWLYLARDGCVFAKSG